MPNWLLELAWLIIIMAVPGLLVQPITRKDFEDHPFWILLACIAAAILIIALSAVLAALWYRITYTDAVFGYLEVV